MIRYTNCSGESILQKLCMKLDFLRMYLYSELSKWFLLEIVIGLWKNIWRTNFSLCTKYDELIAAYVPILTLIETHKHFQKIENGL